MESTESLVSPTSNQMSIRSATNHKDPAPANRSMSGHLLGMVGSQSLGMPSVSSVFPLIHQPGFSLHSFAPGRSEFGGLGTLGMSAALAARSQLGTLPDWWHSIDINGQGSAVFFPHLLGLPALFNTSSLSRDQTFLQSRAASKSGHASAKAGLNGSVNGKENSSSVSSTASPALTPSDPTKSPKSSQKPAQNQRQEKSRHRTKDEKFCRKGSDVSINSDSQSASSSDCSSDALSSSDSDDLEADDDDDDDDQSDDSVESDCGKEANKNRKGEMQTDKKDHRTVGQNTRDIRSSLSSQPPMLHMTPLPFQSFRPSEEPRKHTSVVQNTGLAVSTKPLELVIKSRRDREAAPPKPLSLSSPKTLSHSNSLKPVSLIPLQKPISLSSSSSLSPSSKPPPLQLDNLKMGRNYLNGTLLSMNNLCILKQPFLPQESFKEASFQLKGAQDSGKSSTYTSQHSNLFLSSHPTGNHQLNAVHDAPLALISKPRSQSARTPDRPLLATTNTPIDLTTTAGRAPSPAPMEMGTSTSPGLILKAGQGKGCKTGQWGVKKERQSLVELFRGAESDLPNIKDSDDSLMEDEDENDVSSLSDSDSLLDDDSDDDDDTDTETERTALKLSKSSVLDSSHSQSTSSTPLKLQLHKTLVMATPPIVTNTEGPANGSPPASSSSVATPPGKRRRVTDERALRKPLEYGWQRETCITNTCGRLWGEVAYFAPCGRKLKQYPDIIKYLTRNGVRDITRDHFSFSAKIKVGDFYEARDGPEGLQWCLLKEEEVIPRILALEGRRGRPKTLEQFGDHAVDLSQSGKKSRAPDESEADVFNTSEAKLLRKFEAQEISRQAAQIKLMRKLEKQALARVAKEARRQQAIKAAEERQKRKEQMKILKQQEKVMRIQQVRMERELRAQQILEAKRKKKEESANAKILEAEKRIKEKELRRQQAFILKHQERERRRQHVMLMKAMEARKKAEEKERMKQEKRDEKRLNKERKLELRRLELQMAKELNQPNEDMCLTDHKSLPALSRIPGLVLPGACFSDCLMVIQFLRCFGKVLGLDASADVPSLAVMQAGLLNVDDSMRFIQDLLVRLLSAAVCDPGLPPGHKALEGHLTNIGLNPDNVSEVLQIYMEAHCGQTELASLSESLKTKAFQAHTPSQKASILAFLVNELSCSKSVVNEIDKNIDNMTNLRRDKWVIEGKLRKLRSVYSKRMGKRESSVGEEGQTLGKRKRKRKAGESEDDDEEDDDSDEQVDEEYEEEVYRLKKGKKAEACEEEDEGDQNTSIVELERQIEKLSKQQIQMRRKLFEASHSLRSVMFGQDRYKRRYWVLPQCGGVFVEGRKSGEGPEEWQRERKRLKDSRFVQVKEEPVEEPDEKSSKPEMKREPTSPKPPEDVDSLNYFLQKPGSFSKLSKIIKVAQMSPESSSVLQSQNSSPNQHNTLPSSPSVVPRLDESCLRFPADLSNAQHLNNDQLYKVLTERNTHWFSLLPRSPCDGASLTEGQRSASSLSSHHIANGTGPYSTAGINNVSLGGLQMMSGVPLVDVPGCAWSNGNMTPNMAFPGVVMAPIVNRVYLPTEGIGNINPHLPKSVTTSKRDSPGSPVEKALFTPSPVIEVAKNQDYPSAEPIPEELSTGWWKVTDIEVLRSIEKACHSRGIRERVLQKQLQKHMDYIAQICSKHRDVTVIDVSELEKNHISEDTVQSWCVEDQAMDVDIGVLQKVEELERKVTSASLQVKGWMKPALESQSEDLVYYEHKPIMNNSKATGDMSDCGIARRANNPLDIAVSRLAELERNIARRYLKSPLSSTIQIRLDQVGTVTVPAPAPSTDRADDDGTEEDLAPGLKQWRKAVSAVRNASQLALCIQQLQKSIAWEKSIMKVYCQICRKGDNEELLLLCDGCDKGCHTYCHKPKISSIPDGDWFCPACISQASSQSVKTKKLSNRSSGELKKPAEVKRNRKLSMAGENSEKDSGSANSTPKKVTKEIKKRNAEENPSAIAAKLESPACVKKPKTAGEDNNDLAMCRLLLGELERHQDSWPFLTPVNPKSVPGYHKIIKKPMDLSTIRDKLTNSQYLNLETFIIDVNLVFDNCEKFNEDNSDIGRAGHTMRRFFQRRWTEMLKQNSSNLGPGT
ncbi:bromodomain adjacent to zinc finger domain protein 2B isoform X2 [Xyrauchen texanus]|uniref:bromodomain adjacent to zinc finger domain protein 2B isoform X2 n=1 Tax=Xyrauchen texanus TaxID=154827 RepID=UPI0022418BE9|nr:bromodomain adjacent to zinc finger domain protein 2B isoform X2 [Xyrauchen texanus]